MNAILAANMALRFLLELAGLVAMGVGAWALADGLLQPLLGIGVPLIAATLWAVFRVSGDGGPPVIETPPPLRLLLEIVFFALAVALLFWSGRNDWAVILGAVTLLHYAIGYDRTIRFLTGRSPR